MNIGWTVLIPYWMKKQGQPDKNISITNSNFTPPRGVCCDCGFPVTYPKYGLDGSDLCLECYRDRYGKD